MSELGFDEQIGWELYFYDADGDDNRGITRDMGLYLHRSKAQAVCDELNAEWLRKYNDGERQKHERDMRRYQEAKCLFDNGLRETCPKEPALFHERRELPSHVDHYGVRAIEWEDV